MDAKRRGLVTTLALILALLALGVSIGCALKNYLDLARLAFAFPYPLDYGEGPLLDQTIRLAMGENIYHNNFAVPPYTISNYPPAYLLIQAPLAKLFGPAFWYGRALSLLCALLTSLFIGLTLFTLTRDGLAAVIGGLLLLAFPYVQFWSLLYRIDLLALMLTWAAIFVSARWGVDRRWGIPMAGLLFVASIYTRQSYLLAGPVSVAAWLWFGGHRRKALELAAITAGTSLLLFILINILTRGGFFLNIVAANVNPFSRGRVKDNLMDLLTHAYYLLAVILIFLLPERWIGRTHYWSLALAYLITSTLSALTIGKDGSNVNYLLELAAALCFAAGAALAWLGRIDWLRVIVVWALVAQVIVLIQWTQAGFNGRIQEKINQRAEIAHLTQMVHNSDGIVLADEYMGLLPLVGKRIYYQPFEYKMLADGGLWDQQAFIQEIKGQKFSLIMQFQPQSWEAVKARWTPEMISAIRDSYSFHQTIALDWIFLPQR